MRHPITLTLDVSVRDALDQLALREERSRSWLAERLIREGHAARAAEPLQVHSQPLADTANAA